MTDDPQTLLKVIRHWKECHGMIQRPCDCPLGVPCNLCDDFGYRLFFTIAPDQSCGPDCLLRRVS